MGELGKYQLLEKLGEGGMGVVYKARHTKLKRLVALKVLPKSRMHHEGIIARFEREMEAIGRVNHPNIVHAYDACELIRQAANGLQYAHEHGLIHRDIKPSNLMLSRGLAPFSPPQGSPQATTSPAKKVPDPFGGRGNRPGLDGTNP